MSYEDLARELEQTKADLGAVQGAKNAIEAAFQQEFKRSLPLAKEHMEELGSANRKVGTELSQQ